MLMFLNFGEVRNFQVRENYFCKIPIILLPTKKMVVVVERITKFKESLEARRKEIKKYLI